MPDPVVRKRRRRAPLLTMKVNAIFLNFLQKVSVFDFCIFL